MRKLIYVPVIHAAADLGSLAKSVAKRGIADFGEEFWTRHRETITGFWTSLVKYFANLEVRDFKIYQDGMVANGEVGQQIVKEGIKAGSKNYEIIDDLLKKGAVLVKTEDFPLVKEERDRIVKIAHAKTTIEKLIAYLKYRFVKNRLLKKRDAYIAKRIDETLRDGQTGILFVGAYHNVISKLPKDIQITEVKDVKKIRDYQKLLLYHKKNKEEFEKLENYLVSLVAD